MRHIPPHDFLRSKTKFGKQYFLGCQILLARFALFRYCISCDCFPYPLNRLVQAQTLSLIANSDWPDEYPNLLNDIIALLSTNSPDAVHGAMAVFTEFIKSDLSEDQILPVLRQLLPVLLNILGDQEVSSIQSFSHVFTSYTSACSTTQL
jgi:hypothetical protein